MSMPRRRDRFRMRPRGKPGPLVYAVRDKRGRFVDIQLVRRAAVLDLRHPSRKHDRKHRLKRTRRRRRGRLK